jgi:hypothetical protein
MLKSALVACCAFAALACSDRTPVGSTGPDNPVPNRVATTRGAAIVLTRDEKIAVAANRTTGSITVLRMDPTASPADLVTRSVELDTGEGSEPVAAVIGADDDTAYVLLRGAQAILKVTELHERSPKVGGTVLVGSEPTSIAITPSGQTLFVANWGDGTLSVVTTEPFRFGSSPDLSLALAETGLVGDLVVDDAATPSPSRVWTEAELQQSRPALAHPRALAMTDNGDDRDDDEVLYVTEFFSQPLPSVAEEADNLHVDRRRQGLVYPVEVATGQLAEGGPIAISPVPTGFRDAMERETSCFPNQLHAAAIDGDRLLVTSTCASPSGPTGAGPGTPATPANFKTLVHPAIFAIDTSTNREIPAQHVVLTSELRQAYEADGGGETRMPLTPNDIVTVSSTSDGTRTAYVTALGADAVYRVDYDQEGVPVAIGSPMRRFVDLLPIALRAGRLPSGIALSTQASQPFGLVVNETTRNVSTVALAEQSVVAVTDTVTDPVLEDRVDSSVNAGRRLFATGLGAWALDGQAWSSCESCHPEGGSDGVTWFFPRGPRRTISTAGTYVPGRAERRMLLWTANVDEVHDVEVIARTVSGGIGGVLWTYSDPSKECRLLYDGSDVPTSNEASVCKTPKTTTNRLNGLNGALTENGSATSCAVDNPICDVNASTEWDDIDAFIRTVEATRASPKLHRALVTEGRTLFLKAGCNVCHGGPGWTISRVFYRPGVVNNGTVPYKPPADASSVNLDELRGRLRIDEYTTTSDLLKNLNPPVASGRATFRSWAPEAETPEGFLAYLYGTFDQINCILRAVGTFPAQSDPASANLVGIVPDGAPPVREVRQNLQTDGTYPEPTLALGQSGFNVPSLLGLATGAPYFHAGNARTLEEVFDPVFRAHHQAVDETFLADEATRGEDVKRLVSYLLSLEERPDVTPDPVPPSSELGFDADLCAQFQDVAP